MREKQRRYQCYFRALIDELERLGVTGQYTAPPRNWWRFPSTEIQGILYGTQFPDSPKKVFAHLHIHETKVRVNRLELFYALEERKEEIEFEFGSQLDWQPRPSKSPHARSRIVVSRDGHIRLPPAELECIRNWHIVNLLKLKKVIEPKIKQEIQRLLSIER